MADVETLGLQCSDESIPVFNSKSTAHNCEAERFLSHLKQSVPILSQFCETLIRFCSNFHVRQILMLSPSLVCSQSESIMAAAWTPPFDRKT